MLDNLVCLARINGNKTKYMEEKAIESADVGTSPVIAQKLEHDQEVHNEVETMFTSLNNTMTNEDISCLRVRSKLIN